MSLTKKMVPQLKREWKKFSKEHPNEEDRRYILGHLHRKCTGERYEVVFIPAYGSVIPKMVPSYGDIDTTVDYMYRAVKSGNYEWEPSERDEEND